jgi:hypothetical protein
MPGLNFSSPSPSLANTTGYNAYGINPASKTYAGDTYAAITRDQWANYVGTFVPIENKLINYATDPNAPAAAMSSASQNVSDAFANQEGATDRRLRGLGVTLSPEEQDAQRRATGISKSLADVQAQNTARDLTVQRQQSILGSPVPQGVA